MTGLLMGYEAGQVPGQVPDCVPGQVADCVPGQLPDQGQVLGQVTRRISGSETALWGIRCS